MKTSYVTRLFMSDRRLCCVICDAPGTQSHLVYCIQRSAKVSEVIITHVIPNKYVPQLSSSL